MKKLLTNKKYIFLIFIVIIFSFVFGGVAFLLSSYSFSVGEGESLPVRIEALLNGERIKKCRFGLGEITDKGLFDCQCQKINHTGLGSSGLVCSNCGNNKCEEWESKCNCPDDCMNDS